MSKAACPPHLHSEDTAHSCGCSGCGHDHGDTSVKKEAIRLGVAGICVGIAVLAEHSVIHLPDNGILAAVIALLLTALPIFKEAITGLWRGERNVCELAAIAIAAAVIIGEFTAAAEIAFILAIGELIESYLFARTRADIEGMVGRNPDYGYVLRDEGSVSVPVGEIQIGEKVMVRPGDIVPVDGIVREGESDLDESHISGESLPVPKQPGDTVYSGSVNLDGVLTIEVLRSSHDSSYARVVELVKEAGKRRPPVHPLVDRFARYYTPIILILAAVIYLITSDIIRSVTILVVACPCALLLATPSAVLATIGPAAKKGILVKSGKFLELCRSVTTVVFDKTGTLTTGTMQVTRIEPAPGYTSDEVLHLAASAERSSPHPVAKAIVTAAHNAGYQNPGPDGSLIRQYPGRGVILNGRDTRVLVGTEAFLVDNGVSVHENSETTSVRLKAPETRVMVAVNTVLAGSVYIADTIRRESPEVIQDLGLLGIDKVEVLTGDNQEVARLIAKECRIPDSAVHAGLLPGDKESYIGRLQESGAVVCFVGDGTNDGPALVRADIGIGIGSRENTLALESSDVILMQGGIATLPSFLALGIKTHTTILRNIILALSLNTLFIISAAAGFLSPVGGAIAHQVATVAVLVNSLLLARYYPEKRKR